VKHDYSALDAAILARINRGHTFASDIEGGLVWQEARSFTSQNTPMFRIIDRRLQALRKAGRIAYSHKTGWAIVQQGEGSE
jgi:hypothetical protein